jgi:penicillin-binding protein 1A
VATRSDNIVVGRRTRRPAGRWRGRLPHLSRKHLLEGLAAFVLVLFVIAAVPPFRRAAALGISDVILKLASPLAPSIHNFDALPQPTKILAADGSELTELGAERREPVRLVDLPPQVPKAVLAAEDANFYHHGGFDPTGVIRAMVRSAQGKTQGGSTITQQLAKINYTGSQRTLFRKLRELEYAVRLEKKYTKDQLLERYLNQVYFGDGAYGIAAASQAFFGIPPEQLTPAQAAMLAGKIESPEGLDPRRNPAAVQARRDQVLRNMHKHGWLPQADLARALAQPLDVVAEGPAADTTQLKAPHFVEYVKREAMGLDAMGGDADSRTQSLLNGGYTIETTLDPKMYDAAVNTVRTTLGGPDDPATAMVSVQPGDGAIRMLFGGLTFDRKFDIASQGRRQPGSSFKPYVYLAAIRQGVSPRSQLPADSPQTIPYRGGSYTVNNYEGEGHGQSDLDNALAHSINVVYSRLAVDIGLDNVVQTAEAAGIPHDLDVDRNNPAIALGGLTHGVSPLQQAAAYATFAAKGLYAQPYSITRIKDRSGRVVYTHSPKTKQAFNDKEVGVLNNALMGVVDHGTGTAAASIGRPAAGKTGTTENYGDAWFVGFVPQLATAVWVGDPNGNVPMTHVHGIRVAGGTFPAQMWAGYMRYAAVDLPVEQIYTASPDQLSLHMLNDTATTASSDTTSSSSTSSSSTSSSTTSSTDLGSTTTTSFHSTTTTTTAGPKPKQTTTTSTTTSTTAPSSGTDGTTTTTVGAKKK